MPSIYTLMPYCFILDSFTIFKDLQVKFGCVGEHYKQMMHHIRVNLVLLTMRKRKGVITGKENWSWTVKW